MWKRKAAAFTLKVSEDISMRWKAASRYEGYPAIAPWLRSLAQERIKALGPELPQETLAWKKGTFIVRMFGDIQEYRGPKEVAGIVAGPFGIYRGSTRDLCDYGTVCFTLVHVPTQDAFATLSRQRDCKDLARRLFPLKLSWYQTEGNKVTGPGVYEAKRILALFLRREHEKENRSEPLSEPPKT